LSDVDSNYADLSCLHPVEVKLMTWHLTVEWWCRRRSVDNRDNGAPKHSAWHGAESVEAAVGILNDL